MIPQTGALVYRFREFVTMHTQCSRDETTPTAPTIYLTPDLAREIGQALIAAADDCVRQPTFHKSGFNGISIGDNIR
jgi:hypothetical protein